jgi:siroheme synthase-like protein
MKTTAFYPLFLDLTGKLCVVIGGGAVASRKVRALLAAGASVKLIGPEVTKGIARLAAEGKIALTLREYRKGDLEGAALVFAAAGKEEVARQVKAEAQRRGVPMNAADAPDLCDFLVPSTIRRGPITIAISTSGVLPMLSKKLRQEIARSLTADHAACARRVGAFRRYLLKHIESAGERRRVMARVARADLHDLARMSLAEMKRRFLP